MAAVMLTLCVGGIGVYADFGSGVAVLAEGTEIIKTALSGKKIIFSDLDFKQGLCLTDFEKIEITGIPESNEGTLLLAGRRVGVGTVIKRKNIGALVFVPASKDVAECKFTFKTDDFANGAEVSFILKFTDKVNYAPKIDLKESEAASLVTQRDVKIYGKMNATDTEGDSLEYVVISYPEVGNLEILDASTGEFLYTPPTQYTGTDSFRFVARDEWGNFSKPAEIEITVCNRMSEVVYEDMKLHKDYNAAIALTAMNAVDGRLIGDGVYFMPDDTVTLAEFVTMAMKCAGIKPDTSLQGTFYDDNDEIPPQLLSYMATAQKMGLIQGSFENGELLLHPNSPVTKYQAAMIMAELVGGGESEMPVFADGGTVPVYAEAAVAKMCALGIFDAESENINATSALTKAECVSYLYELIKPLQ